MPWFEISIGTSEAIAIWLIWKLWKSNDFLIFKIGFSVIALIPFLGPFMVWWSVNIPSRQHPVFQDRVRFSTDVLDRWRHVIDEKNPNMRLRMWRQMVKSKDDNHP